MKIKCACISDCGQYRGNNEDNIIFNTITLPENHDDFKMMEEILITENNSSLFGVFDGMGGAHKGEVASAVAAEGFNGLSGKQLTPIDICMAFETVGVDIHAKSKELNAGEMGTTGAIVYIDSNQMHIANVGDSRVYLRRDRVLYQMSKDHTDAQLLKQLNITHRNPTLTQFLGMGEETKLTPHCLTSRMKSGDAVLICSDGLTEKLEDRELFYAIAASDKPECILEYLVCESRKRKAKDNITAILLMAERV